MGAWIEIDYYDATTEYNDVAPFVGAWIEIWKSQIIGNSKPVAPFVGAWIEISRNPHCLRNVLGRSLRGSVD